MAVTQSAQTRVLTNAQRAQSLVLPNYAGSGIKVQHNNPQYTWRDLEGQIRPRETGVGAPALAALTGDIRAYAFAANDVVDIDYHWPHDWVPGSDVYMHVHWTHNGTNISGSLEWEYRWTWAKGHNQASFNTQTSLAHTATGLNITNTPIRLHRIEEIQFSSGTPTGGQLDTKVLEVDGLLLVSLKVNTIPTITGGSTKPFILYSDIHYLSTNIGTLNRAPDFYL